MWLAGALHVWFVGSMMLVDAGCAWLALERCACG